MATDFKDTTGTDRPGPTSHALLWAISMTLTLLTPAAHAADGFTYPGY